MSKDFRGADQLYSPSFRPIITSAEDRAVETADDSKLVMRR